MSGDDDFIPFIPIKEYEASRLRKLLDTYYDRDEAPIYDFVVHEGINALNQGEITVNGESYTDAVDLILEGMGLEKYAENFKAHDLGVNMLLHMNKNDLTEIGITNMKDQEQFRKHLFDFNGGTNNDNDFCMVEEDLIMAKNVCSHLEDINEHLKLIQSNLIKTEIEDYYVSPTNSILKVFHLIINRTVAQATRMSEVLFSGSFDSDNLIGAYLQADELQLPHFMVAKLYKPDKAFKVSRKKYKWTITTALKIGTIFALGFSASFFIYKKYSKK